MAIRAVILDLFDTLVDLRFEDAPVERVTGADIPMPYAANLEVEAIPVAHNVINAVQKVCYRS